jgi:tripartite-type tricarboxylate transporter receptor subunit TctC
VKPLTPIPIQCALRVAALVLLLAVTGGAFAEFPSKPVTLVVPNPAGSSSDVLARALSMRLAEHWGREVIVENLPAHGSASGPQAVSRATPDGHVLLAASAALPLNEALSPRLPYHALRDFATISLVARQPIVLITSAGSTLSSVADVIGAAREQPGQLGYGSTGGGCIGHLAGELFRRAAGVKLRHVAYPAWGHALKELKAGHLAMAFAEWPVAMPHVQNGRLRPIAVTSPRRLDAWPDLPALAETVPELEIDNWVGILAPYGLTVRRVRALHASTMNVTASREFRTQIASLGYEVVGSTPGEFHNRLAADIERYSRAVAAAAPGLP